MDQNQKMERMKSNEIIESLESDQSEFIFFGPE